MIVQTAMARKYLYVEHKLGGCYEPIPTSFYVSIPDSVNIEKIIQNDSLLIDFIKQSQIVYASELLVFSVGHYGVDEQQQDDFIEDYAMHTETYSFFREEKWDNFKVKLAIVEHRDIKYKNVKFGYDKEVGNYQVDQDGVHIEVVETRSYNVAYAFE
tara:strand:+ start:225 stop:695 length:471 start_codon:yes stop_codon:yes gene_type:complete